jgi:hypothetical protein
LNLVGKMQYRKTCLAVVVTVLTTMVQGVSGTPVIDQEQPLIDGSVGGLAIGGASEQKLAQVVTAGASGPLTEVRFPLSCDSGDLIVEIQGTTAGKPNGVVLTSETIPASSLPFIGVVFRSLAFSTPVSFTSGDVFAIVLRSTGACGVFRGPVGDSYLGGNAFFDALPNPPGWVCICDFAGDRFDLPFQTLVDGALQISIDIEPGAFPNSINPKKLGVIPVAILGTDTFDAATVDPSTVRFGATGAEAAPVHSALQDVNGDGKLDMILQFAAQSTGIVCGMTSATLTGKTVGDQAITGADSILTVNCR